MIPTFFILSSFVLASPPQPTWFEKAGELNDEQQNSQIILQELKKDIHLEDEIRAAFHSGSHLTEAMDLVRRMNLQVFWVELFQAFKNKPSWSLIRTLETLNKQKVHDEWKPWLKEAIESWKWSSYNIAARLAFLEAALSEDVELNVAEFDKFLKEDDADIQRSAIRLLSVVNKKKPMDSKVISAIKKALALPLYQARLEAFWLLKRAPNVQEFSREIKNCVANEKEERVKKVCRSLNL
jgi:hypothetical protein